MARADYEKDNAVAKKPKLCFKSCVNNGEGLLKR